MAMYEQEPDVHEIDAEEGREIDIDAELEELDAKIGELVGQLERIEDRGSEESMRIEKKIADLSADQEALFAMYDAKFSKAPEMRARPIVTHRTGEAAVQEARHFTVNDFRFNTGGKIQEDGKPLRDSSLGKG